MDAQLVGLLESLTRSCHAATTVEASLPRQVAMLTLLAENIIDTAPKFASEIKVDYANSCWRAAGHVRCVNCSHLRIQRLLERAAY